MTEKTKQKSRTRASNGQPCDAREKALGANAAGAEDPQVAAFLKYASIYDAPEADEAFADAFRRILPVRLEQRRRKVPPMRQKRGR